MHRLHRSIREIDATAWNRLAGGNAFASHGWLLTTETSCRAKLEPLYFTLYRDDALIAGAVCYVIDAAANIETVDDMVFGRAKRLAGMAGVSFLPALVCGSVLGYGWHIGVAPDHDAGGAMRLLMEAMESEAKSRELDVSFTLVLDNELVLQEILVERGYARCRNVPIATLDLSWNSFEEYLDHLPGKSRGEFRRQMNRNRAEGSIIGPAESGEEDRLLELDRNSLKHSEVPFAFGPNFFVELQRNLNGRARIFTSRKTNSLTGTATLLVENDTAFAVAGGVDHVATGDDFTYFQVGFYAPISHAIDSGIRRIYFGRGMYEVKLRRGCQLVDSWVYTQRGGIVAKLWFPVASFWNRNKVSTEPRIKFAFGPGLVHLLGSISPNDLIANSVAGAAYGYSLLWTLIIAYGLNYFISEAASRYVIATGESIMEGYGRLGRTVVLALTVAIFIRRHLNNLFLVLLLGSSIHMLVPLPTAGSARIWSAVSFALAFWLMFQGGYKGVEKISKVLVAILSTSIIAVALMSHPAPAAIARGLLVPSYPGAGVYSFIVLLMAVAGTSVGSINHLKYPAFVYEKGWRSRKEESKQKTDLALSVFGQFLFAALIQIAAAATLYGTGAKITSVEELAAVFSGPLGQTGRVVLGVGMSVVVFSTYLGSNTGYSLIVADAYERFLSKGVAASRDAVRKRAYRALLAFFCISPLYVLFTSWNTFWLGLSTSAMFLLLTPLLLVGLLRLTNDGRLMKDRRNGLTSRLAIGAAILVSIYLTYQGAIEMMGKLGRR